MRLNKAKEIKERVEAESTKTHNTKLPIWARILGGEDTGLHTILFFDALSHKLVGRTEGPGLRGWVSITRQSFCKCPILLNQKHRT
jgi:hypothetical protein